MDETSAELLGRFRSGESAAANELYARYVDRLTALARKRLSGKLAARFDPEDVVQSAYRSFFIRARDGQFSVHRSGDLWRLLVGITLHKLMRQVETHRADRRSVANEGQSLSQLPSVDAQILARGPDSAAVVELADQLQAIMVSLDETQRSVLELRLQDYTLEEIAARFNRSERTIRRWLDAIKTRVAGDGRIEPVP